MKRTHKSLIYFFTIFILNACKQTEVNPDLALIAEGTYKITTAGTNTQPTFNIPSNAPYTVVLTRTDVNVVNLQNKLNTTNIFLGVNLSGSTSSISLSKTYSDGSITGTIKNKEITFTLNTKNGDFATVTAIKI